LAQDGGEWSVINPGHITSRERDPIPNEEEASSIRLIIHLARSSIGHSEYITRIRNEDCERPCSYKLQQKWK